MSISRRKFLQAGTIATIAVGIPLKVLASESSIANSKILSGLAGSPAPASLDSALFSRYVNTQFTMRLGEVEAKFTLVKVHQWSARTSKKSATGRECFSLVFENTGNERLTQETYTASHSALGEFPLFVVPAGKTQKKYEALFNRLHG